MGKTVYEIENSMSYAELLEWISFYKLEPFGNEERMFDARHGTLCSLVVNALGSESKPIDFMMYKREEVEDTSPNWEAKLLKAMTTV